MLHARLALQWKSLASNDHPDSGRWSPLATFTLCLAVLSRLVTAAMAFIGCCSDDLSLEPVMIESETRPEHNGTLLVADNHSPGLARPLLITAFQDRT
jgi:hypothetical protein